MTYDVRWSYRYGEEGAEKTLPDKYIMSVKDDMSVKGEWMQDESARRPDPQAAGDVPDILEKNLFPSSGTAQMERCWLWLCSCPGLYRGAIAGLMSFFHSPKELYESETRELIRWKRLADDDTMKWVNSLIEYKDKVTAAEAEARIARKHMSFVSRYSEDFPQKLLNLPDCPYGLFYRGHLPDPDKPAIAVVGARRCSSYGQQMAGILGKALAEEGYQVISGMAAGVDGIAQAACIAGQGSSYAVLGCGVDVCYPPENARLFDELPAKGGVISEYAPGTPPIRPNFPQRNRLISGLSDCIIVVEAREKSGSLITADLALDQGKSVYAVPGRFNDLLSYGCNRLIEQGAGIVLSTDNLLQNLAVSLNLQRIPPRQDDLFRKSFDEMTADEQKVYTALNNDSTGVDEIASETGLTLLQCMRALISLQLKKLVVEVSKNRFALRLVS